MGKQASQEAVKLFLSLSLFFCEFLSLSPLTERRVSFSFSFLPSSQSGIAGGDPKEEEAIIELRYDPEGEAIMRSSRGWICLFHALAIRLLLIINTMTQSFFSLSRRGPTSAHIFSSLPIQSFFFLSFFLRCLPAPSLSLLCMGKRGEGDKGGSLVILSPFKSFPNLEAMKAPLLLLLLPPPSSSPAVSARPNLASSQNRKRGNCPYHVLPFSPPKGSGEGKHILCIRKHFCIVYSTVIHSQASVSPIPPALQCF